jgi:hypothetical protein
LRGFSHLYLVPGAAALVLSWTAPQSRWSSTVLCPIWVVFVCPTIYLLGIALGPLDAMLLAPLYVASLTPLYPLLAARPEIRRRPILAASEA